MQDARLNPRERKRYEICKKQIADGLQTVFDTGAALTEIRDSKLYREDFETFKDFCQQTYQIGEAHAYRLIDAADVKDKLKNSPVGEFLTSERQAREAAKVPENKRESVLQAVIAKNGELTAETIKAEAEKKSKPRIIDVSRNKKSPQDAQRTDRVGQTIPASIIELWDHAMSESAKLMSAASTLRCAFKKANEENDLAYAETNQPRVYGEVMEQANNLFSRSKDIEPHAICSECQGRTPSKCIFCRGRGFISHFSWKQHVGEEKKQLIARVVAAKHERSSP